MTSDQTLLDQYWDWASSTVDEKGFEVPWGIAIGADDAMTVIALAVPPPQAYAVMLTRWLQGAKEMIFALDRFALDGQGTTLGDLLAGHYFTCDAPPRPFIIEYQHEPRIVQPFDWANAHWNAALTLELKGALQGNLR